MSITELKIFCSHLSKIQHFKLFSKKLVSKASRIRTEIQFVFLLLEMC